ncbi:hypothetical protein S40285_04791 [Stachybotrys chlorohalonatus IBT 40285]|uniref:Uncharacterized protein n=1 Tax=Stachybotrys chlorohalonatus (strain IBT 40285) TaxID=1283841 RepID=A0A084QNZ3_STAC4|nr:hypothetical protein S40285_04791 [Stachybotrys chlorohalonata IBT 40285]
MPSQHVGFSVSLVSLACLLLTSLAVHAQAAPSLQRLSSRQISEDSTILNDPAYLPAQIGAIVGAYAVSLVLVAFTLLALSKKRRSHLNAGNDEAEFDKPAPRPREPFTPFAEIKNISVPNFSYPSPIRTEFNNTEISNIGPSPYVYPSPTSSLAAPGVDPQVDQRVVAADRIMAQQQLEDMYKYVMEHEEAKQKGLAFEPPPIPGSNPQQAPMSPKSATGTLTKKERSKPASLNLTAANEERTQSRTSSLFSALRSPKKKSVKGVTISSPIMTPQSSTFPRHEQQEMGVIPPRHYAPAAPPPIPTDHLPTHNNRARGAAAPVTPDLSPESTQSIDERIGSQIGPYSHYRNMSQAPTEVEPDSATSEHSQVPLVSGLPSSPKPGARFPTLPASPKPGATFQRPNPSSAVRAGGTLPLRAYEPALGSSSTTTYVKQTVFERKGPLSPTSARTPFTAGAVPYSPYQPFTPCVPVTPSLVTREDRKRMKRLEPKTPTMEMVQSSDEVW